MVIFQYQSTMVLPWYCRSTFLPFFHLQNGFFLIISTMKWDYTMVFCTLCHDVWSQCHDTTMVFCYGIMVPSTITMVSTFFGHSTMVLLWYFEHFTIVLLWNFRHYT